MTLSLPQHASFPDMPPWSAEAQTLECVAILPETRDAKTLCFRATDEGWFRYLPGQFITLELPIDGPPCHRTYTLSSSPSRPLLITVTVKAQADSTASRWLIDNLQIGDRLKATGPAGLFSSHLHPADKYLLISAGSGVTPMMSMARWMFDTGHPSDVTFINCARRPSEIIFRTELERMAARVSNLSLAWVVREPDPYAVWTGYRGRLNGLMLELIAPDYVEREIFCCGPAGFMQNVRDFLHAAEFDMDHYHEESFQAPVTDPETAVEPDDVIPDERKMSHIRFAQSGVEAVCRETDTILEVARNAGLNIPSGCQFGVCGTCKVRCVSGETHMVHNGGIHDQDIEQGYVLACCTKPLGAIEVEA
ncbi:MAG: hybrid-cluster NAD(P)-dependent oxidoreductase [Pseudomonadota bacterium]